MNILLWDIETAPLVVTAWQLFKPYITYENVLKESHLLCAAWKWLDGKRVYAASVDPAVPEDDAQLVEIIHGVLSEADVLVGHNGDKFDLKKFNARAIHHGLKPLPPIPTIDTLKVARKHFAFTSNRLDYLGQFLGVGQKIETEFKLWLKAMAGDKAALAEMVKYNKQDVVLLEQVYLTLRPYIRNHPNAALDSQVECCPNCASTHFTKQGFKRNRTTLRQQYQCGECGSWFSGALERSVKVR